MMVGVVNASTIVAANITATSNSAGGAGGGLLLAVHDATAVSVSVMNVIAVRNKLGL